MSLYSYPPQEGGKYSDDVNDGSSQNLESVSKTKLIVNYLPQSMLDAELHDIFSRCGEVISCKIIRDRNTMYSFGYGFVEYSNPEDAKVAIDTLKGYPIQNKRLGVTYSRSHDRTLLRDTNLYVSNIPESKCNEESLREIFKSFGTIILIRVLSDTRNNRPRNTAFVRYDTKAEADRAISALNGTQIEEGTEPLQVRISEEHGKQRAETLYPWNNAMNFFPQQMYDMPPPDTYTPRHPNGGGPMRGRRGRWSDQGGLYRGAGGRNQNFEPRRGRGFDRGNRNYASPYPPYGGYF